MDNLIKKIAWDSIYSKLNLNPKNEKLITKYDAVKISPDFVLPRATFITLKKDGKLRGCIGSLVAHREFYDDLVHNSVSAAFSDPRFKPVTPDEIPEISLEVSILTPATLVKYDNIEDLKNKIAIGIDGIILKDGQNQATFLPQVWEELQDFETFFSHLCQKARTTQDCLKNHPQIYKYQVEKIK